VLSLPFPLTFLLNYQYREYHFSPEHLRHPAPNSSKVDLDNIHNTSNVLGLVLAFHVSFAIAARKTAQILTPAFRIPISYQTVLNYAEAAAPDCHHFNLTFKGAIDDENSGEIAGQHAYVFFISASSHKITTRATLCRQPWR
jgi:hypothetical protein